MEQSKQDPQVLVTLAKLKDAKNHTRNGLLMEAGWVTLPGSIKLNKTSRKRAWGNLQTRYSRLV